MQFASSHTVSLGSSTLSSLATDLKHWSLEHFLLSRGQSLTRRKKLRFGYSIGGETVFYPFDRRVAKEEIAISPETGMLLLHKHGNDCMLVSEEISFVSSFFVPTSQDIIRYRSKSCR